nr:Uncharacterised protein [Klebsiella pneumoniae]
MMAWFKGLLILGILLIRKVMISEAMGITIENTMITQCLSLVLYSFIFPFQGLRK